MMGMGPEWTEHVLHYNTTTKDGIGMGYKHVTFSHLVVGIAKNTVPILYTVVKFDRMPM